MEWLEKLDVRAFRWINMDWTNPLFDQAMPFLSGNAFFYPALVVLAAVLIWKARVKGLICVVLVILAVGLTDGFVVRTIKAAVARPRPFLEIADARCLIGKGSAGSMPSGHAANWFAAAMVSLVFFRRSAWVLVPLAVLVSVSRVYNGVHYPSDVLAGAIIGAGCAVGSMWLCNTLWALVGRKWFPLWWEKLPNLLSPPTRTDPQEEQEPEPQFAPRKGQSGNDAPSLSPGANLDQHWLRLGYLFIVLSLAANWLYIASHTIELSEDEAYQWVWSKHLDLSYYSKPPLIAYAQFIGTGIWGDTAFGVRFLSPLIGAVLGLMLLRFFAREVNARAGFILLLVTACAPLMAGGSVLMTIDPLSVLFWMAAMISGWHAVQGGADLRHWLWTGLWMGLGFLSKYTQLFQLLCWAVFFALWPAARKHLLRPGPWLALLINAACSIPVLIWNARHGWITVKHVSENAGAGKPWSPTLKYFGEFVGAEFGLLNPVFFIGTLWAACAFWRRYRRNPRFVYFFSMGAPLFLCYTLFSFKGRVFENWIAPAVLPLFCLMVAYWDAQWRLGRSYVKNWLGAGLVFGAVVVILFHDTNLVQKLTGVPLPMQYDPLKRVRGWEDTARLVDQVRQELREEGKPVFIIGHHYGLTGQLSFYIPEARTNIRTAPLVYYITSPTPRNQFYFWPGYKSRKSENAIFVRDLDADKADIKPPPAVLLQEFESVTDLGVRNVMYRKGQILRPVQFFACRNLK